MALLSSPVSSCWVGWYTITSTPSKISSATCTLSSDTGTTRSAKVMNIITLQKSKSPTCSLSSACEEGKIQINWNGLDYFVLKSSPHDAWLYFLTKVMNKSDAWLISWDHLTNSQNNLNFCFNAQRLFVKPLNVKWCYSSMFTLAFDPIFYVNLKISLSNSIWYFAG